MKAAKRINFERVYRSEDLLHHIATFQRFSSSPIWSMITKATASTETKINEYMTNQSNKFWLSKKPASIQGVHYLRWFPNTHLSSCNTFSEVVLDVSQTLSDVRLYKLNLNQLEPITNKLKKEISLKDVYTNIGIDRMMATEKGIHHYTVPEIVLTWLNSKREEVQQSMPKHEEAYGWTKLHMAVYSHNKSEVLRLVHECGHDPNPTDTEGWNPLLWAVVHNSFDCCQVLLDQCGADIHSVTTKRSTMHNLPAGISVLDAVDIYGQDRDRFKTLVKQYGANNQLRSQQLESLRNAFEDYEDY
jgi:hypothetical protein